MYEKIKNYLDRYDWAFYLIMAGIACAVCWFIYGGGNDSDYQRATDHLERAQEQQRESVKLNRDIQYSIDRSSKLSHEAKGRIERSAQYNIDIGNRIDESQNAIHEARSYLVRNAELFDRIERANRQRQENNQATTDTAQPISDGGSGGSNRSSDSSIER